MFGTFSLIVPRILSSITHATILLVFWCLLLLIISPLLFPCSRYPVLDIHLVHVSPFPIDHAEWSLVFRSFGTSSQRLKTALSLVYNLFVFMIHANNICMFAFFLCIQKRNIRHPLPFPICRRNFIDFPIIFYSLFLAFVWWTITYLTFNFNLQVCVYTYICVINHNVAAVLVYMWDLKQGERLIIYFFVI